MKNLFIGMALGAVAALAPALYVSYQQGVEIGECQVQVAEVRAKLRGLGDAMTAFEGAQVDLQTMRAKAIQGFIESLWAQQPNSEELCISLREWGEILEGMQRNDQEVDDE
jgi:hypothetical protein